jgi:Zn-dependent M28 family amino/carboxypeptidase
VRFIFFTGEEQGLLGSDYYVSQLSKKQVQDISAMLGKGASTKPKEFKGHHKVP